MKEQEIVFAPGDPVYKTTTGGIAITKGPRFEIAKMHLGIPRRMARRFRREGRTFVPLGTANRGAMVRKVGSSFGGVWWPCDRLVKVVEEVR